jgi:uncharacterized protein
VTPLEALLAAPRGHADAVPHRELRGFLFAVLNGPEPIPPSEWIPEIFGGVEPEYESPEQAQAVRGELMALNDDCVAPLATNPGGLPIGVVFKEPPVANFDDDAPVASWARGFAAGYGWIEDSWDGVDEEFGAVIAALAFFSSKPFAVQVFEGEKRSLEDLAARTVELFALAAEDYQTIGRSVAAEPDETD